jgi:hypothetical protein
MFTDDRPVTFLTHVSHVVVPEDDRPVSLLTTVSSTVVFVDAHPTGELGVSSFAVVRALLGAPLLHNASSSRCLFIMNR